MSTLFFNVNDKDISLLKSQWDNLTSFYTSDRTTKDDTFQILKGRYTEKARVYHNLNHVKTLLNLLESLDAKVQDHNAIRFSIWFHDAVYDTRRNDNEEESARLASKIMGELRVNSETIYFVRDLILATKEHRGKNPSYAAKLFLDMDMAILGTSEEVYKEYSKAIREEYSWVSASTYRRGRQKVLMSFMERDTIYLTDEMKLKYEEQARKNIHREIKSLDPQRKTRV